MVQWKFNADDYKETSFAPIPVGDHRVRIANAEEKQSSNGNDMIALTLDVSGHTSSLWYYLVFMPNNPQMTNQKLGQIFDSFGIAPGDMNINNWVGKSGACRVKHEKYNGEDTARVSYFLSKQKQETLPAWQEPAGKASVTGGNTPSYSGANAPGFTDVSDEDLPF